MSETKYICTVRAGSHVRPWRNGILECHPEHPPRLHFMDGSGHVDLTPIERPKDVVEVFQQHWTIPDTWEQS